MIYRLTWLLCRGLFRLFFGYRIEGARNVPAAGAVILASNHVSNLDPPVVGVGFWRPAAYMAKEELFARRLVGWYLRRLHAFPVRRGAADRAALKRSLEVLEGGGALVMFPEGTRSESGELQPPELGVGMIACRSGAPVIPVYIAGTREILPRGGGLRRGRIRVCYGPPLPLPEQQAARPGRAEYESAAARIMQAISALRDSVHGKP